MGTKSTKESLSFTFDESDSVDNVGQYIEGWKKLCSEYQKRIANYPELEKAVEKALSDAVQEKLTHDDNRRLALANTKRIIEERNTKLAETEEKLKQKGTSDALEHFRAGDYDKAEELFKAEAKEGSRRAAEANYFLGDLAFARLLFKDAAGYYEKATALDPENSEYLNMAGRIWHDLGEYKRAIEYFEQALAIDRKTLGDEHSNIAVRLTNIGMAWNGLGEYRRAIEHFDQALAIDRKTLGDEHPHVAIELNNIGLTWNNLGEYQRAIECFEQALAIDRKTLGDEHSYVARDFNNIGGAWIELREYKKAVKYFEQALVIDRKTLGDEHPNVDTFLNNIGGVCYRLGEYKKAIWYFEQALNIDRKFFGDEHPDVAMCLNNIGGAWKALVEYKKAIGYFEQALEIDNRLPLKMQMKGHTR